VKAWSIRRWLTRWLALTSIGLILAIASFSAWFLRTAVNRELDALVNEELDEMHALFSVTDGAADEFDAIAADLASSHSANPFAWRVWSLDGSVWHESGDRDLLERAGIQPAPLEVTRHSGRDLRWRVEALDDGRRVGLVVDGSVQVALLARFGLISACLVTGASFLAWAVASFLSRRTSELLRLVAEGARAADGAGPDERLTNGADLPEEIREVARALRATLAHIQAESNRAQLMTAGLAHELRSPLQNLLGEAEVALMRSRDPAEYQRVLESQMDELRDLARAVDNLVLLCAQEEPVDRAETFDLGDEAALRLDRDGLLAARSGVRLELECGGDLTVRGDREALVLALRNLVSNAMAWSPPEGVVQVSIQGADEAVEVTVDDQGPGIPPELAGRVFEPFQRGPQAADRRVGFGLGLALARTAVAMHGGRIFAERSPAGGARLRFVLPRQRAASRALATA